MVLFPVLLLGMLAPFTQGYYFELPKVSTPRFKVDDQFPVFPDPIPIELPYDWHHDDPLPPIVDIAEYVEDMVQVYLEAQWRNGKISQHEEDDIWHGMRHCLDKVINDPDMVESLKDWTFMTEFIELAITRSREYSFWAPVPDHQQISIFKRLTPVRFWRILQDVPFPVADAFHFEVQKQATVLILEDVCRMVLPYEVQERITMTNIQDVFFTIIIKSYIGDAITEDNEAKLRSPDTPWALRYEWEEIASRIVMEGSLMKSTCIDPEINTHRDRSCIEEIRTIATDLGVYGCIQFRFRPFEMAMFSYAPEAAIPVSRKAPEMERDRNNGAPGAPKGRSDAKPAGAPAVFWS